MNFFLINIEILKIVNPDTKPLIAFVKKTSPCDRVLHDYIDQ